MAGMQRAVAMDFLASWRHWAATLLLFFCAACTTGAIAAGDPEEEVVVREYRLGPGDQLRIVVFGEENLTGEFLVSPSGSISYPLVGEVPAQGRTVNEFAAQLAEVLRGGYVRQPNISVEVASYRPFFILGEVGSPGTYPYAAGLTVMNAVATAGGFTYRADIRRVYIKHPEESAERLYRLTSTTPIQPGDTVRIPERRF
jgi:polysaccharide export outer membrane protein